MIKTVTTFVPKSWALLFLSEEEWYSNYNGLKTQAHMHYYYYGPRELKSGNALV